MGEQSSGGQGQQGWPPGDRDRPGSSKLAWSAASSLAVRSRRRVHHAAGCHQSAAAARSPMSCHAGSRAAESASSWTRIACLWSGRELLIKGLPATRSSAESDRRRPVPQSRGMRTTRTRRPNPSRCAEVSSPAKPAACQRGHGDSPTRCTASPSAPRRSECLAQAHQPARTTTATGRLANRSAEGGRPTSTAVVMRSHQDDRRRRSTSANTAA